MKKKGIIFIVMAALIYWGYVYFFKANRAETVKKAAQSTVSALYRANKNLIQVSVDDFHAHTGRRYPSQLKELV